MVELCEQRHVRKHPREIIREILAKDDKCTHNAILLEEKMTKPRLMIPMMMMKTRAGSRPGLNIQADTSPIIVPM